MIWPSETELVRDVFYHNEGFIQEIKGTLVWVSVLEVRENFKVVIAAI